MSKRPSALTDALQSVALRVSLIGTAGIGLMLLVIVIVMSTLATTKSRDRIVTWVSDKSLSVADTIDAFDASSRKLVEQFAKPFKGQFAPTLNLDSAGNLSSFGESLNNNFSAVDKFHADTGGEAKLFARSGDSFTPITTSLRKADGERVLGDALDATHPAHAALMRGEAYMGRVSLLGKQYMARYEPVKDDAGQISGAMLIGFELSSFVASLEAMVADLRFFETGGVFVIDPKGASGQPAFVLHPNAKGKAIGDVNAGAAGFLSRLEAAPKRFLRDAPPLLTGQGDDRWAVMQVSKRTGWWVVAEVSDNEAMASHWATLIPFIALLAGATVVLGFGLHWMMRKWVGTPLRELGQAVGAVANGDLSVAFRCDRRDDVGDLIGQVDQMRQKFAAILAQVKQSTESVSSASGEIAAGNLDLSNRTELTASNLQNTANSMHGLTSTVRQSAEAAAQANQLAASACQVAQRGGKVVSEVVATMNGIDASSRRIADIIGTIDSIAFQTNILALNAAVEAARAGEQGRGFAVVASEVRSLAQRSADAAREIKALIGASVDQVKAGTRLVDDAGATMADIVASVQRVSDIIGEISASSVEQDRDIGQINSAITQLDQMTQQNAALVEESAAAAESLKEQAARLAHVVQGIHVGADALAAIGDEDDRYPSAAVMPPAVVAQSVIAQAKRMPPPVLREEVAPRAASKSGDDDWESF